MKTELIKTSHAVGESNFHIQLTPAFRRPIFADEKLLGEDWLSKEEDEAWSDL